MFKNIFVKNHNLRNVRVIFYSIIISALLINLYFLNNPASFFKNLANFYCLINNQEKFENSLDKAFSLGLKDEKLAHKYISLLVNKPPSLDVQIKLIRFLKNVDYSFGFYEIENYIEKIKNEIEYIYSPNYIEQASFNNQIMHWGTKDISYYINKKDVPDIFVYEIEQALKKYEEFFNFQFNEVDEINEANIVIDFLINNNPHIAKGQKFIMAYTTPVLFNDTLKQMVIKFNIYDNKGNQFSSNQFYNTVLHEIFHSLGFMGHSYQFRSLMYLSSDINNIHYDIRQNFSLEDINTLNLLYKIKPEITCKNELKYDYVPYVVLGNNVKINEDKLNEAQYYIKKAPNLPNGYIDLSIAYFNQKQYEKAIKCLEKALELCTNEEQIIIVYKNLAILFMNIGDYKKAEKYALELFNYDKSEESKILMAEIYNKLDIKKAIKIYEELYHVHQNNMIYVINLAKLYYNKKNYFKARKILKDYLKQNPQEKNNPQIKQYGILIL